MFICQEKTLICFTNKQKIKQKPKMIDKEFDLTSESGFGY